MSDVSDEILDGVIAKLPEAQEMTRSLLAELQRRRAAVAADKERIKAVVREVCRHVLELDESVVPEQIELIATRAAERLATAAVTLHPNAVKGLTLIGRSYAEGGHNWSAGTDAADVKLAFTWIESLRPVATSASTTRIEFAISNLGSEHEPPAGWEQRVMDAATVGLNRHEAALACDALGSCLSDDDNALDGEAKALRRKLRDFIDSTDGT